MYHTESMVKSVYSKRYQQLVSRLKKARRKSGLTQVQVAKVLSRPQAYVSKIESGAQRLDIVDLETFAKLYKQSLRYF